MTIDEMINKRKELCLSYSYISEKSGVPISTVQKIFNKVTPTPRMSTLNALNKAFSGFNTSFVAESEATYTASSGLFHQTDGTGALSLFPNNSKTIKDYLSLPESERKELIDGVFYDMASPTLIHQRIAALIYRTFENSIKSNNGKCIPFVAPADVQLDCDDKTIVQPDVFVVCNRGKITKKRLFGAPDLIIEVLSESNWYMDMVIKRDKYKEAGVREYWIIIPDKLSIQVYNFEKSDAPRTYSFKDKIPVSIWDGNCVVDFAVIYEDIAFMF